MTNDENARVKVVRVASEDPVPTQPWTSELWRLLFSRNSIVVIAVVIALFAVRLSTNLMKREKSKVATPIVRIEHPGSAAMDPLLSLPGNIEAIEQASVYAHVGGYLKKIFVDEGDHVKKGQLLAQIDAPDIIEDFNKAKAELNFKKVTRDRYQELINQNVISQQEFDTVDAAYNESRARFQAAAANMAYTEIRAPFDGAIARRYKYPGDLIAASTAGNGQTPIFLLVNESELRIVVNVPQSDLASVELGNVVETRVDTFPNQIFHGKVSRVDALLEQATKTQRVLIDLENSDKKLHAGMFATVILHFNHVTPKSVVTVPTDAIQTAEGQSFVLTEAGGVVHRVKVTLGLTREGLTEITSGLTTSDNLIAKGTESLKDGDKVSVAATAE